MSDLLTRCREVLREAADTLLAHRLRVTLSAVGIVTGVGTVVAALAITNGARQQAIADIGRLGVDNIIVRATDVAGRQGRRAPVLTVDDAEAVARRMPSATVAVLRRVDDHVRVADRVVTATAAGVSRDWQTSAGLSVAQGRWFLPQDRTTRTAVIGADLAFALFREQPALGAEVEAAGEWRTVIGVLARPSAPRGASSSAVQAIDTSRTVFLPLGTLDLSLGAGDDGEALSEIVVHLARPAAISAAAHAVRAVLDGRHPDDRAYEVIVPYELLTARLKAERGFHLLLLAIGTLALVVSGVGIMNIMVASVTERAAEIGIRRAFGAPRGAILRQFAVEAGLLSAVSAAVGIPCGLATAFAVAWGAGWPVAVTVSSLVLALALALAVGLGAAVYPARLAADLSPVDAIRS